MKLKRLNEELKKIINEIDAADSFKQELKTKAYEKGLYKALYNNFKIDIQTAQIREIPVPKSSKEIREYTGKIIILSDGDNFYLITWYGDDFYGTGLYIPNGNNGYGAHIPGKKYFDYKEVNLESAKNIIWLLRKDAFTAAWILDGVSTKDIINQRREAKKGSVDRIKEKDRYWYDNIDKSGYKVDPDKYKKILADLKKEDGSIAKQYEQVVAHYQKVTEKVFAYMTDLDQKHRYSGMGSDYGYYDRPGSRNSWNNRYLKHGIFDQLHDLRRDLMAKPDSENINNSLEYTKNLANVDAKLTEIENKLD